MEHPMDRLSGAPYAADIRELCERTERIARTLGALAQRTLELADLVYEHEAKLGPDLSLWQKLKIKLGRSPF